MQLSTVFGSCVQSVGTAASVLFTIINRCGHYTDPPRDSTVTRQAKMLYISLLESVQKERGEWQGFSSSSTRSDNNDAAGLSPRDLLTSNIARHATIDQLGLLSEIIDVGFRNLMGPVVPVELYTRQKTVLLQQSVAIPPALSTLLAIRNILHQLERDVQHCLLRLFALWDLIARVNGESHPLLKTIAEKSHHILRESSEFENRTARKSERQDGIARNLLHVMVLYRDLLFSDIEFILTKQELQLNSRLWEPQEARAWPGKSEPVPIDNDDRFWSDSDIESSGSDENQLLHDETGTNSWGQYSPLESFRSRTWSGPTLLDDESHDHESEGRDWSQASNHHDDDSKTLRSRMNGRSPPMSGEADPLVFGSTDNFPSSRKLNPLTLERIPSGRRRSQRSLASTLNSPTPSALSQASSSTRSTSRKTKSQSHQSSSLKGRFDRQRHAPDATRSEVRSSSPRARSMNRSTRTRHLKHGSVPQSDESMPLTDDTMQENAHREKRKAQVAAPSRLLSLASSVVVPIAAATLCVVATVTTLAIYEMRRAPRN